MDYVTAWFYKASEYILNTKIQVGFVSTNSITQGEQVGILWSILISKFNIKIHFAHQTFKWNNEARGVAAVYCVIIGFSNFDISNKYLYLYDNIKGDPNQLGVKNINPYLVDAKNILISNRSTPLCNVPDMMYGSKPTDGGHFILTEEEKNNIIKNEPSAKKYIFPFINAKEFLNNENRWCLWLVNADPSEIKKIPEIMKRIEAVKKFRSESKAETTRNYKYHTLFRQIAQPSADYILVPSTTSEKRKYIPFGFLSKGMILSNASFSISGAKLYHFGILTSEMHMTWVRYTCGRLKSDFRYSKDIVYNNFPWPENPSEKNIKQVEVKAQAVLDIRKEFPDSSLADMYDPLTMPPKLVKAHNELDKAVDLCYRSQAFVNETKRIEFLFELYEKYTAGLYKEEKKIKKKKSSVSGPEVA